MVEIDLTDRREIAHTRVYTLVAHMIHTALCNFFFFFHFFIELHLWWDSRKASCLVGYERKKKKGKKKMNLLLFYFTHFFIFFFFFFRFYPSEGRECNRWFSSFPFGIYARVTAQLPWPFYLTPHTSTSLIYEYRHMDVYIYMYII